MASVLDLVRHYQQSIEKYPNDETKVLKAIDKLFGLEVTVQHLQSTGVGRTVNALRKEPGDVGQAARALVYKWKVMVAAEESDHEADQNNDTTNYNGHGNRKDLDGNAGQNKSRVSDASYERSSSNDQVNGNTSGSKRKYDSSEEENSSHKKSKQYKSSEKEEYGRSGNIKKESSETDNDSQDSGHSHSSESESEMTESSEDDRAAKRKIKAEPVENHRSSSKHASHNYVDQKKEESVSKSSNLDKYSHGHSSGSKHSYDKSSSRERSQSSHKHKSSSDKEHHSERKHKSDSIVVDKDSKKDSNSSSKSKSSSDRRINSEKHSNSNEKHKSSSDKHKSSSEKHRSSSDKNNSSSEKYRSSEKQKSSSQKDSMSDKHKEKSDKNQKHESKLDKHSNQSHKSDKEKHKSSSEKEALKHKSRENSSSSKEKHSSSSKEKSKDSGSSSKEKSSDSHKSDKKVSSHESKSKESKDKTSKKDERSSEKRSKHKSSSSSHKSDKSSSKSTEDVLKVKSQAPGADSDDGIDCGSGASFAEALGMVSPAKPKKKSMSFKEMSSPTSFNNDLSPLSLLAPCARLAPLPALEISALPEISPHYRPRPPPRSLPHFTDEEALSASISSKNQRTKVYSGNKVIGKIPSLYELCVQVLQEHIDALEFTGGVPYEILKPIVDRATPQQLFVLEYHNPYLTEDTDHLWKAFCEKNFRNKKRQEMEAWREMYIRCQEEREDKLKSLTANIRIATEAKKAPIKQTKMAYVDSVVKPPRNILRKQAQHGTALLSTGSPAARVAALAAGPNVLRGGGARPAPALGAGPSGKPKKAPLMAKALQFMRGRKR